MFNTKEIKDLQQRVSALENKTDTPADLKWDCSALQADIYTLNQQLAVQVLQLHILQKNLERVIQHIGMTPGHFT